MNLMNFNWKLTTKGKSFQLPSNPEWQVVDKILHSILFLMTWQLKTYLHLSRNLPSMSSVMLSELSRSIARKVEVFPVFIHCRDMLMMSEEMAMVVTVTVIMMILMLTVIMMILVLMLYIVQVDHKRGQKQKQKQSIKANTQQKVRLHLGQNWVVHSI